MNYAKFAFTDAIKALQEGQGSRKAYEKIEKFNVVDGLSDNEIAFIQERDSFYMATYGENGYPYIQHRGGPKGFVKVIDNKTIGFVDFAGNRQFITQGNLAENPKAYLFLIDYAHRRRIKLWGEARVVEGDAELTAKLMPENYKARAEQVILFTVGAWDMNCPQHIPQRFEAADVAAAFAERDSKIAELEAELARLRLVAGAA